MFLTFAMGLSLYLTRSILPAMLIHGFMNVPVSYPYDWAVIGAMLIGTIVFKRSVLNALKIARNGVKEILFVQNLVGAALLVLFAIGMNFLPEITIVFFSATFLLSIGVQIYDVIAKNRRLKKVSLAIASDTFSHKEIERK